MTDGMKVEFRGTNELLAYLKGGAPYAVTKGATEIVLELTGKIRGAAYRKLSGPVLQSKSGKLRDALQARVETVGGPGGRTTTTGRVYISESAVAYARIQEYGGRTSPHDILPVRAGVLAFMSPAKLGISKSGSSAEVYAKIVHHPGSRMPERSYLRSSLAEYRAELIDRLRGIVK